jgi:suppressor of ftsI
LWATLLVNGVQSPYVEVSRGWVRLRLLNASNSRRYQLQMSDGRLLHVISGDQGSCRRRFRSSSCRWPRGAA